MRGVSLSTIMGIVTDVSSRQATSVVGFLLFDNYRFR